MNRPTRLTIIGFAIVLAVAAWQSLAYGQSNPAIEYITVDCVFSANTITTMENGKLKTFSDGKDLTMTFSGFDKKNGNAQLIGNAGSVPVAFFESPGKLLIAQVTDTKNGTMTSMELNSKKEWVAFHSRHMWLFNEPIISHYQNGRCRPRT